MTPQIEEQLKHRWLKLATAHAIDADATWMEIRTRHREPHRAYHNLEHVADCLQQFDTFRHLAEFPLAIEFAIWFHDLINDPRAADNEEKSAEAADVHLLNCPFKSLVVGFILATKHTSPPQSGEEKLLCDIDLSILGRNPEIYQEYSRQIRREYSWVSEADYARGRKEVLQRFLARTPLFHFPEIREQFEESAKTNLRKEIASL